MYDVTVVYPGDKGEHCPQDERDLLEGKFPEKIHFHIRRFQECGFSSRVFSDFFFNLENSRFGSQKGKNLRVKYRFTYSFLKNAAEVHV